MISSWLFLAGLVLQLQFWWSCSTTFVTIVCGFNFSCVSGFSLGQRAEVGGQLGQPEIHKEKTVGGLVCCKNTLLAPPMRASPGTVGSKVDAA